MANYGSRLITFRVTAGSDSTTETLLPGEKLGFWGNSGNQCTTSCILLFWCSTYCTPKQVSMKGELLDGTGASWHWGGHFSREHVEEF